MVVIVTSSPPTTAEVRSIAAFPARIETRGRNAAFALVISLLDDRLRRRRDLVHGGPAGRFQILRPFCQLLLCLLIWGTNIRNARAAERCGAK
jgi:hypothetical protein